MPLPRHTPHTADGAAGAPEPSLRVALLTILHRKHPLFFTKCVAQIRELCPSLAGCSDDDLWQRIKEMFYYTGSAIPSSLSTSAILT